MGSDKGSEWGACAYEKSKEMRIAFGGDGVRGRSADVRTEGGGMGSEWEG